MDNVVSKGAKPADPMQTLQNDGSQLGSIEDLGGPTPENYRPDDDSAKLKDPGASLKQVRDVVNSKAVAKESVEEDAEELVEAE